EVERRRGGQGQQALGPLQVGRTDVRAVLPLERGGKGGALLDRERPARGQHRREECHGADREDVDVQLELPPPRLDNASDQKDRCRKHSAQGNAGDQALHAASSSATCSSSVRRPTSASIASSFIVALTSCGLNFAREKSCVRRR